MKFKYADNLQKGDLIVVSYSNWLTGAIFYGYGKHGNPHFLIMNDAYIKMTIKRIEANKKPYVTHINTSFETRIAKVREEDVDSDIRNMYNEYKSLLNKNGYL